LSAIWCGECIRHAKQIINPSVDTYADKNFYSMDVGYLLENSSDIFVDLSEMFSIFADRHTPLPTDVVIQ